MTNKKSLLIFAAVAWCAGAAAQTFPEGATPLSPEALQEALSGKTFSVDPASGPNWHLQFNANGDYFLHAGKFHNIGKWSTKESSICRDSIQVKSCDEMRVKDSVLYLKRDSGEIVTLQPRACHQTIQIMAAARWMAPRKLLAVLS